MSSINKMPKDRNCLLGLDALISCFIVICFSFLSTLVTLFSAFYIKKKSEFCHHPYGHVKNKKIVFIQYDFSVLDRLWV